MDFARVLLNSELSQTWHTQQLVLVVNEVSFLNSLAIIPVVPVEAVKDRASDNTPPIIPAADILECCAWAISCLLLNEQTVHDVRVVEGYWVWHAQSNLKQKQLERWFDKKDCDLKFAFTQGNNSSENHVQDQFFQCGLNQKVLIGNREVSGVASRPNTYTKFSDLFQNDTCIDE